MADDGLELNLVFNAPKPKVATERVTKRAEYRAKKAEPKAKPAAVRTRTRSPAAGPAVRSSRGAPSAASVAAARANLKRKAPSATPASKPDGDEHAAGDIDGDEPMRDDDDDDEDGDDAAAIAAKAAAWQSLKQPRFNGDTSVKSSTADTSDVTDSADTAAASSTASTKKPPFRPVSKPLPKIHRHEAAQLDASAFKPVTPATAEMKSVFGDTSEMEVDSEGRPVVKIENGVVVKEELAPLPTTGFGALGLSSRLLRCLVEKLQLKYPTKIQKEGIPLLLAGTRDALIKSETGTGKTLTYLIPIVERLSTEPVRVDRTQGTRAIILSPTRELCLQIQAVLASLLEKAGMYWLVSGVIMGGEKKNKEKARLRKGIHMLICTPGRLLDHLENTEALVLSRLSHFVLDEADRLMDMGFEKDLTRIVTLLDEKGVAKPPPSAIRDPRTGLEIKSAKTKQAEALMAVPRRQNLLVSATLNPEIETMAKITLKDPILIGFKTAPVEDAVKMEDADGNPLRNANHAHVTDTSMPSGLVQLYLQVEHRHKVVALAALLRKKVVEAEMNNTHFKAVVFFSTCASAEFHHSLFKYSYWPYDRSAGGYDVEKNALIDTQLLKLHGNLTQQERTKTYQQFCKLAEGILFCTDVAARGLDLPAVDYIFQYDAPEDTADYIHRVGRTARMGRKGQAILFLMESEMDYLNMLKDRSILPEPLSFAHILQSLHSDAAKNKIYDDARGGTPAGAILQKQFEALVNNQFELKENAINAYHSYLRAYAAYPKALKAVFHPRKLHIGHVARSFGLNEAPTALAKSEIVAKQRQAEQRDREREKERMENERKPNGAASTSHKKRLIPLPASTKPIGGGPAAATNSAAADSASSEGISSGVRPAYGQRDRARNVAAQASDTAYEARKAAKKPKMELSTIGWKLGTEGNTPASGKSKQAKTGIDRARSNKVAQAFKRKKMDQISEFAS